MFSPRALWYTVLACKQSPKEAPMLPEVEDRIQHALDYIEDHLKAPVNAAELAQLCGYSLHHFCHLFEQATGLSVMRYVTRRRLLHAAYEMHCGCDALTCALAYGFDTHAGFYKAFRRAFGLSPTAWMATHQAMRPPRVYLKEVLPMTDPRRLAPALSVWGLGDLPLTSLCYPSTGRMSDHTFAAGKSFWLKTSPAPMDKQALLHVYLHPLGLAPRVLPTGDGRTSLPFESLNLMLLEVPQGHALPAEETLSSPQLASAVGEGLARLHQALLACSCDLFDREDLLDTLLTWAIPTARRAMVLDDTWLSAYTERITRLFPALPVQLIHRDPNPDNLFLQDDRITAFLHFDMARVLPRIFDLAYAATALLSVTHGRIPQAEQLFIPTAHAIWQGYDAVSPLTAPERAALPDMVVAIQLICVAAFSGSGTLAVLAETNQSMLRFILSQMDQLTSFI